eukprot:TRINITY_DN48647_c0_g1_i1.p1 TRINITY_DN48647_c0_g1~~TRINITY_DN48647_c0_g1_i1.p1  ORF type:complete len:681 (-),score=100.81 TRINITY_DN48647_c0_g1_i1:265-2307(-)
MANFSGASDASLAIENESEVSLAVMRAKSDDLELSETNPDKSLAVMSVKPDQHPFELVHDMALSFRDDPRRIAVESVAEILSKSLLIWEVVGGNRGGIVVRDGASLKSQELKDRLTNGSLIRELGSKGDRIQYQLLEGQGPRVGWVSSKVQGTELLASVSTRPELSERVATLMRRLAMMPVQFRDLLSIPLAGCQALTEDMHSRKGCLGELSKDRSNLWLSKATSGAEGLEDIHSAFPDEDSVLASLLADPTLRPVRRIFPRARAEVGEPKFEQVIDPASGLLPDTMATAYFLSVTSELRASHIDRQKLFAQGPRLQGAVRFGAQSTQSMSHVLREEVGEFFAGVHGGAEACLLYDAGIWLGRLAWAPNATLRKISCQFSKPCPAFTTIEVLATLGKEDWDVATSCRQVTAKVTMKMGKLLIASAEVCLVSFPVQSLQMPEGLPSKWRLACPSIDWVPEELSMARLPEDFSQGHATWDTQGYLAAAFNVKEALSFPPSCAAVEDTTKEIDFKARGIRMRRVERANHSVRGGSAYHNDLCFPGGLAPAAISHVHYFEDDAFGTKFEGTMKFGPQATEACFLEKGARLADDGCMSLAAHYGMPLAAIDDFLAHLARYDGKEKASVTWKLEMDVHCLVPIGHELEFRCVCPKLQKTDGVGTSVMGDISLEGQVLVTASAIITS